MREKRLITVADPDLEIRGGRGGHPDPAIRGGGGGSHPDPAIRGGGGGHPDPEIRKGAGLKKFFRPFGPQFGLKSGGPSPGSATRLVQKFGLR